jgi:CRP-like cAMP-binding protein
LTLAYRLISASFSILDNGHMRRTDFTGSGHGPDLREQNRLLAALPSGAFGGLSAVAPALGTVLQEAYAPIEHVYFPADGLISLVVRMREGTAVETGIIGNEGAEGTMVACGAERAFTTATVQVAGRFLRMPSSDFVAAYRKSQDIGLLVDRYHAALFFQAKQLIACNAVHAAEARLARWLLQVRDRIDATRLPVTHEFLAQMLAVRRTTVTEVLGGLQARGLVRQYRGAVELVDEPQLQAVACECYGIMRGEQVHMLPPMPLPA